MSLRDLYAQDAAAVFLNTDDWAQEVTRNPLGNTEEAETITAIFIENQDEGLYQVVAAGEETKRTAHMTFAHSQEMHERDTIEIHGETWSVASDPTTDGVLKKVFLTLSRQSQHRKATKRGQ